MYELFLVAVAHAWQVQRLSAEQARSQGGGGGGGVGGVPTPPSGINDIHNFNYLIQERPFDCF